MRFNQVIKVLIFSDFLLQCGWGLIGPIFAIFITDQISDGSVEMVGFTVAIFWLVKSMIQPFVAKYLDRNHGERDDFIFMVIGMYIANTTFIGYIFASQMWQVFILDAIRGAAMACVIPTWAAIFTRHVDKGQEAFSWSIQSTMIGLAIAFAAAFGGVIATSLGFKTIFVLVAAFGLMSSSSLFLIKNRMYAKDQFITKAPTKEKPF